MTTFKYKVNDRIKERNSNRIHGGYIDSNGRQKLIKARRGIVKAINVKKNSAGANVTHYQVLWDNQSRLTEIQAHRIEHEVV
jgi:hypothetical protein|tara:strand:- start:48 stop:293 length:246 start_codon:yes stop_codon:yes gene_type:complete